MRDGRKDRRTGGQADRRTDEHVTDDGTFTQLIYRTLTMDAIEIKWRIVGSVRVTQYDIRRGAFVDKVTNLRFREILRILGVISFSKSTVIHGVI
jgi:hypothetical protein